MLLNAIVSICVEVTHSWYSLIDQLMLWVRKSLIYPAEEPIEVGVLNMHRTMAFCNASTHCHDFDRLPCSEDFSIISTTD